MFQILQKLEKMAADQSPSSPKLDSSSLDEDAFVAPETIEKAEKTESEQKLLWSGSKSRSKTPDRSILAREIIPPRLSTETVSVLWSSSKRKINSSSNSSKQETRLPPTFYPFDMLFAPEEEDDHGQKSTVSKPACESSSVDVHEEIESTPTSSNKKKKKKLTSDMLSPTSSVNQMKDSIRKSIGKTREDDIDTKLEKLKEEALLTKDDDVIIIDGGTAPSSVNVSAMATPQSNISSMGKLGTSIHSNQTPSSIPGLLFGLQTKSPNAEGNSNQSSVMQTPTSTTSNSARKASSSSTIKVPGAGSVQLTSWWLSGGPPDFSPPSVSSWLDSTRSSGKKSVKSQRPSDVLLDNLRKESANVKAFEERLKNLVDVDDEDDNGLQEHNSRPNKKGRLTVV